jgi:hypothetical protein
MESRLSFLVAASIDPGPVNKERSMPNPAPVRLPPSLEAALDQIAWTPFVRCSYYCEKLGLDCSYFSLLAYLCAVHALTTVQAEHLALNEVADLLAQDLAGSTTPIPERTNVEASSAYSPLVKTTGQKRSTERGEGQRKLTAALTKHHRYSDGGCLNMAPIGNNALARLAEVDQATASAFFKQHFDGHSKYRQTCADKGLLIASLKLLNGEFSPHHLMGRSTGEGNADSE